MLAALRPILFKPAAAVAASYDADAAAYFAAVATAGGSINAAGKTAYNDYIVGLKAAGIWAALDRRWCWAAQDSIAALMCIKSLSVATAVAAPTHTPKIGYDFNGTNQYINSGFDLLANGINYMLNAAHAAIWVLDGEASNGIDCGVIDDDDYSLILSVRRVTTDFLSTAINSTLSFGANAQATAIGLNVAVRTGSLTAPRYKNGAAQTLATTASAGVPTSYNVFFGACNTTGLQTDFSPRAQAMASLGGILDATMAGADYTLTAAFLTAMAAS